MGRIKKEHEARRQTVGDGSLGNTVTEVRKSMDVCLKRFNNLIDLKMIS